MHKTPNYFIVSKADIGYWFHVFSSRYSHLSTHTEPPSQNPRRSRHPHLPPPLIQTKMGMKAKKSMMKKIKKGSTQLSASVRKDEAAAAAADFLPLEGGPARKLPVTENSENKATVLYIGRIPHGFYENEMEAFFKQFGEIKRIRIARNKKTGKSKHFGFLEFVSPEVAKIVAETMHNYLLFEHLLQVQLVPPERVHPKLWKGVNRWYKPLDWVHIERKRHNKERTFGEHKKLVEGILKRDQKRRKKIEAAGIDYECPEIVGSNEPAPKKIRFED